MEASFVNTLGMKFVRIEPGTFLMGQTADPDRPGDWDERPVHTVHLTIPFYMGVTEVTNAQYEQFDPAHRVRRGERRLSKDDDEAAIFVTWHDATAFCVWLSQREGRPYRLPTEAEWEYACRGHLNEQAGPPPLYHTGDTLPSLYHKHQEEDWDPVSVPLHVGRTPPNTWGLHDMHGNVEEWCYDWYGPYEAEAQTDPVGRVMGTFKVTRGGSHNTPVAYLRSANRAGTLPEDCHWLIGFRVVMAELPETVPLPTPAKKLWATAVSQKRADVLTPRGSGSPERQPSFEGPICFVRWPEHPETVPMYKHNHCPSITWCDNGDLLAAWFSCERERGREMTILASRLRAGETQWDLPSEFFNAPDRNMTGTALFNDGHGKLYHFNGLEAAGMWANLALVMRTSTDNGATWTHPRLINPHHQPRNQVISGTSMTKEGYLIQPCDAVYGGSGGTAIHISRDGGVTWQDPGAGTPKPDFQGDKPGGTIAGIHAGVVQLNDGRLLAFGRGDNRLGSDDNIQARMPMSLSEDMGRTWHYAASEFPPINGGQRLVLMRLREGPLLFVSFTDSSEYRSDPRWPAVNGLILRTADGKMRRGYGMFAALSFDEGATWPIKKLVSPPAPLGSFKGGGWTGTFTPDTTHAEPMGYLAATQSPDGIIHLISSALYYRFNLAWLEQ
jgi:formylglycine-generating enzyme required for sulfatase activity